MAKTPQKQTKRTPIRMTRDGKLEVTEEFFEREWKRNGEGRVVILTGGGDKIINLNCDKKMRARTRRQTEEPLISYAPDGSLVISEEAFDQVWQGQGEGKAIVKTNGGQKELNYGCDEDRKTLKPGARRSFGSRGPEDQL